MISSLKTAKVSTTVKLDKLKRNCCFIWWYQSLDNGYQRNNLRNSSLQTGLVYQSIFQNSSKSLLPFRCNMSCKSDGLIWIWKDHWSDQRISSKSQFSTPFKSWKSNWTFWKSFSIYFNVGKLEFSAEV